jgi:intracellular septation protein A
VTAQDHQGGDGLGPLLKRMAVDLLSAALFLVLLLTTGNILLAVGLGVAAGVGQAIWMIVRKQSIDPMQWMALALVVVLGGASVVTRNPAFVVLKPSISEGAMATMMLRPGWAARYAPSYVADFVPRWLTVFAGYVWSAAFFALAASNLVVARVWGLKAWALYTSISPWALFAVLFGLGLLIFPPIVRRAARARGVDLTARRTAGRSPLLV